jgi:uncharacterized membrane protein
MGEHYLWLKWLHVIGAAVIFGTGLGTAFHFWITQRREGAAAVAAAARSTVLADYLFTLPAVIAQPITGIALARVAGYPLDSRWIVAGMALYFVAGACWIPVVLIQRRLHLLARHSEQQGTALGPEFAHLVRWWTMLGWPAFLAMAAAFWVMIAKPA